MTPYEEIYEDFLLRRRIVLTNAEAARANRNSGPNRGIGISQGKVYRGDLRG